MLNMQYIYTIFDRCAKIIAGIEREGTSRALVGRTVSFHPVSSVSRSTLLITKRSSRLNTSVPLLKTFAMRDARADVSVH